MNSPALASTITQSTTTAEALVTAKADAFIERERSALEKAGVPKEEIRNLLRSPAVKELKTVADKLAKVTGQYMPKEDTLKRWDKQSLPAEIENDLDKKPKAVQAFLRSVIEHVKATDVALKERLRTLIGKPPQLSVVSPDPSPSGPSPSPSPLEKKSAPAATTPIKLSQPESDYKSSVDSADALSKRLEKALPNSAEGKALRRAINYATRVRSNTAPKISKDYLIRELKAVAEEPIAIDPADSVHEPLLKESEAARKNIYDKTLALHSLPPKASEKVALERWTGKRTIEISTLPDPIKVALAAPTSADCVTALNGIDLKGITADPKAALPILDGLMVLALEGGRASEALNYIGKNMGALYNSETEKRINTFLSALTSPTAEIPLEIKSEAIICNERLRLVSLKPDQYAEKLKLELMELNRTRKFSDADLLSPVTRLEFVSTLSDSDIKAMGDSKRTLVNLLAATLKLPGHYDSKLGPLPAVKALARLLHDDKPQFAAIMANVFANDPSGDEKYRREFDKASKLAEQFQKGDPLDRTLRGDLPRIPDELWAALHKQV